MVGVIAPPRGATASSSSSSFMAVASLLLLLSISAAAASGGGGNEHASEKNEVRKVPRKAPVVVDACDACAAAAYSLHDALSYQQARRRATFGSDVSLAELDPTEVAAAVTSATNSACGSRGFWQRFNYKLVDGATPPLLTLSGPGLDAHFVPGLERPDDEQTREVGRCKLNPVGPIACQSAWFQSLNLECDILVSSLLLSHSTCTATAWRSPCSCA
jgi:hypothetical protein